MFKGGEDCCIWKFDHFGVFYTKSFSSNLEEIPDVRPINSLVWAGLVWLTILRGEGWFGRLSSAYVSCATNKGKVLVIYLFIANLCTYDVNS